MTKEVMGPNQILNPWEWLAISRVKSLKPCSIQGTFKQGKSHQSPEGTTAVDSVWDSAQMEGISASSCSFSLGAGGTWGPLHVPRVYPRAQGENALSAHQEGDLGLRRHVYLILGVVPAPGVATRGDPHGGGLWVARWPQNCPWVLVPHTFIFCPT